MNKEEAMKVAADAAKSQPTDLFLERIAERLGAKATVQAVFGEPIERGDVTVVPVARVRWGFGGGSGRSEAPETGPATGSGGGGGVTAEPVGYLELGPNGAEFKPITSVMPSPGFILAGGFTLSLILRAIGRLIRG